MDRLVEKIQENPLPEQPPAEEADKPKETLPKAASAPSSPVTMTIPLPVPVTVPAAAADKPAPPATVAPVPVAPTPVSPRLSVPMFSKTSPNDLYRRLLPAMLFVLTFVTVMTMLLIYMDTVALGAQKFRANMSRDYELASIAQGSAALVAFVQQLHLAPPPVSAALRPPPAPTPQVSVMDKLYGEIYNGTFIEWVPRGARAQTSSYLERARAWRGVVVRAAARDYLALRGNARALHACLSPTAHPREVTYQETESQESVFSSRVLCLPLLTVLLAADAPRAHYVLLGGNNVLPALTHLPFEDTAVHLQIIEVQFSNPVVRNETTHFLQSKNYTVAATFDDSVMYALGARG
ncbi:EGF receptor activation regulator Star isoform X2 [Anticarsia gemmatalis]|uniref:EGF receptor activation regulator Star isoform X2 n=1 Tax=Anticarsia gemmatalis TaxID=129554 RepID=UPI003F76C87F